MNPDLRYSESKYRYLVYVENKDQNTVFNYVQNDTKDVTLSFVVFAIANW